MARNDMYRLNGIAHVAGYIDEEPTQCVRTIRRQQKMILHDRIMPYLDSAGLLHVARLNDYWFKLDAPLISAFVERWRPETHTFHMSFGECTITLQDVAYQFGLPVDGFPVSGCHFKQLMEGGKPAWQWFEELFGELPPENCIDEFTVSYGWFQNRFRDMPNDATEPTSGARVHLRWLPYVADLDGLGKYSWGSATLSWLYRCLCRVANRNVKNLAGPLSLLQSWIFWRFPTFRPRGFDVILWPLASRWGRYIPSSDEKGPRVIATRHRLDRLRVDDFIWMPYSALEVIQVVHPDILRPEHTHLWKSTTALIYFSSIEWHQDGRGPTRWFHEVFATWHECWDQRHQSVLTFQLVPDPRPSVEYLDWWYRVARRFLSHDRDLVDPRQAGVPADAPVRGNIAVPARQQGPNFPDNRRRATRERVRTRYSQPLRQRGDDALELDETQGGDEDHGGSQSHQVGWGHGSGGSDWGWGGGAGWSGGGGGAGPSGWGSQSGGSGRGGGLGSGWGGGAGGSGRGGGAAGSGWGSWAAGGSSRGGGARGSGWGCGSLPSGFGGGGFGGGVETTTLFADFCSPNQMEPVFGAGSDFFAEIGEFASIDGDYRPQFEGGAVDLNVDLNESPTTYQGGPFAMGGTPASAVQGDRHTHSYLTRPSVLLVWRFIHLNHMYRSLRGGSASSSQPSVAPGHICVS
ncbi:uncharacterized protein DS421_7g215830 [Arachis hypogaea]|nr:uncharacterized protein DS421_7g215830 [Arachis hypogaea]